MWILFHQFFFYFIFCHWHDKKLLSMFPFKWGCCFWLFLANFGQTFMKKLSKFAATRTGSVIPSLFWQSSFGRHLFELSCLFITSLIILLSLFDIFMFFTKFVWIYMKWKVFLQYVCLWHSLILNFVLVFFFSSTVYPFFNS